MPGDKKKKSNIDIRTSIAIFILIIGGIIVLYIGGGLILVLLSKGHVELPAPAEQAFINKYDSLFKGTVLTSIHRDQDGEDKSNRFHYGHGIYHIVFESRPGAATDFKTYLPDSTKAIGKQAVKDFLPAMTHHELYDSILVYFVTRYQDTVNAITGARDMNRFSRVFEYSAR